MKSPGNYINMKDLGPSAGTDLHCSIDHDLQLLAKELNGYLCAIFEVQENIAVVSSLVGLDGSIFPHIRDKVVITFLTMNIEQTTTEKLQVLEVLISANFIDSIDAIRQLSAVADFFQAVSPQGKAKYFEAENDLRIVKLDKDTVGLAELFKLLGANYIPSLVYRVAKPLYSVNHSKGIIPIKEDDQLKETIAANIDLLLQAFVFAPNKYPTWLAVSYLVDEYLFSIWKAGKLIGEKPKDAYEVHIGLGKTMTPEDILNGDLILNVMLLLNQEEGFTQFTFKKPFMKQ